MSSKLAYFKGEELSVSDPTDNTLAHYIIRGSSDHAADDKIAFVDTTSKREVTFGEFRNKVSRLSHGLIKAGFEPGQVACIYCCNLPEFVIAQSALIAAGLTVTLCNSLYSSYEIAHQIKDSKSVVIFTSADSESVNKCVKAAYDNSDGDIIPTDVKQIITLSDKKLEVEADTRSLKLSHYLDLLAPDAEEFGQLPNVKVNWKKSVVYIPYSSGTTGLSKGVVLTHYNLYYQLNQIKTTFTLSDCDAFLVVPPLYHIYGVLISANFTPMQGITCIMQQRFDFQAMLEATQTYKVTKLALVPPIVLALAKHPLVAKYDLSSVSEIITGAAPMPAEQIKIACDRVKPNGDICFTQGYGMTEGCGASTLLPADAPVKYVQEGSVGKTMPGSEIKVISLDSGETVKCGEEGEVCMRAPSLMQGYVNRAEETAKTISKDGWLRSGDVGHLNEDGYLWITDRLKELIKYKGFQVPPAQLEAVLLTHEAIQECAVVGIPDEEAGELPRAYVKLKTPFVGKVTEAEVQAYVKERVAPFKQLKGGVKFVDEIPKSGAGKLLRRVLKDNFLANKI